MSEPDKELIIVGIDLGADGGLCFLDKQGKIKYLTEMPIRKDRIVEPVEIYDLLKSLLEKYDLHAVVERTFPNKESSRTSSYNFGRNVANVETVIQCLRIPLQKIVPENWKKHFTLINKTKKDSVLVAVELYPDYTDRFIRKNNHDSKRGVYLDGLAESYLIGEYYRRITNF